MLPDQKKIPRPERLRTVPPVNGNKPSENAAGADQIGII
jgi:hypothetical protein